MTLSDISRLFKKSWIMIVVFMIIGCGAAAIVSSTVTRSYTSTTRLFVSVSSSAIATPGDLVQANNFAIQKVASYVSVIPSERVMSAAIERLGLEMTPEELAAKVSASTSANTVILDIRATDPNPQQAASLVTGVAEAFSDIVINELESPQGGGPGPVKVEVIQPASLPTSPTQPQPVLNVAIGTFAGFAIGLVIAVVIFLLDPRVHKLSDAARIAGSSILGGIGRARRGLRKDTALLRSPHGHQAESYRSVRTALHAQGLGGPRNSTLLVTSSVSGEGKTSLVVNLGVAFAQNNARVLLIDADLRHPGLAAAFGLRPAPGLGEVLAGEVTLESATRKDRDGIVDVLGAGSPVSAPSEVLGSTAMTALLEQVRSRYDIVVIDSSPLLPVTDAAVLSTMVDTVIMVAATGTVTKDELRASTALLRNITAKFVGLVVTKLPRKGSDSYRYARYGSEAIDAISVRSVDRVNAAAPTAGTVQ
ncbi:MAG: polysaccharide biosynthesis tyrosine autokinase [Rhodoglobus sp.]